MVSTLSFSSRVRLRRRRVDGEPSDKTRRFLYLNQMVRWGDDVTTGKWDPRTHWEVLRMCLLGDKGLLLRGLAATSLVGVRLPTEWDSGTSGHQHPRIAKK